MSKLPIATAGGHIHLGSVSHGFDTNGGWLEVIRDIALDIEDGSAVALVGPSGCGKTTLLNMVAGFLVPNKGSVLVGGLPVDGPGPDRGVVFQNHQLFPWLTVEENVGFGLKQRRVPARERKTLINQVLDRTGLSDFQSHYPSQLSGGMAQRVAVARVLVTQPKIILLDEPFGALDAQMRIRMQEWLLSLLETYRPTRLLITHDVDEAILLSDIVYVLSSKPGRIIDELAVPFDYPRTHSLETINEYIKLKSTILDLLFQGKED